MTDRRHSSSEERDTHWRESGEAVGSAIRHAAKAFRDAAVKETLEHYADAFESVAPAIGRHVEELAAQNYKVLCSFCGRHGRHMFGDSPNDAAPAAWICERCIDWCSDALCEQRRRAKS